MLSIGQDHFVNQTVSKQTFMDERIFTGRPVGDFSFRHIRYEKAAGRATITFNRPEVLNSVNFGMLTELNTALKDGDEVSIVPAIAGG